MKLTKSNVTIGLLVLLAFIVFSGMSVNTNQQKVVYQTAWGTVSTKLSPGPFLSGWGPVYEEFNNTLTYDFRSRDGECLFKRNDGIRVRYQDGGEGTICGLVRVTIPNDDLSLQNIQREYFSEEGVRTKLLGAMVQKVAITTPQFMTSTEAYASKRSQLEQMIRDQLKNGPYKTTEEIRKVVASVDQHGIEVMEDKAFPVPLKIDGIVQREDNKFTDVGIIVSDINITGFDFEDKTRTQIDERRDAENKAMTSKALARAALEKTKQIEAEAEAAIAKEYGEKQVAAQEQIVAAQRDAELATIQARKETDVAKEQKQRNIELTLAAKEEVLRQKQITLAKAEEAKQIDLIADARATERKKLFEADGGLQQKLDAQIVMNRDTWDSASKQKWAPEIVMGGNGNESGNAMGNVNALIDMMALNNAKQLNADMSIKGKAAK